MVPLRASSEKRMSALRCLLHHLSIRHVPDLYTLDINLIYTACFQPMVTFWTTLHLCYCKQPCHISPYRLILLADGVSEVSQIQVFADEANKAHLTLALSPVGCLTPLFATIVLIFHRYTAHTLSPTTSDWCAKPGSLLCCVVVQRRS